MSSLRYNKMLSADYSKLFSSGIRALSSRGKRRRRATAPAPTRGSTPAPGVSYISFEPDTPTSPGLTPTANPAPAWRKAMRRVSLSLSMQRPARRSRRMTMPAGFAPEPEPEESSIGTASSRSSASGETRRTLVEPLASATKQSPVYAAHPHSHAEVRAEAGQKPERRRPAPLSIIVPGNPGFPPASPSPLSPRDFLSFSTTSSEFPSPRLCSARPHALTLAVSMHPYARCVREAEVSPRNVGAEDWRKFHEDGMWAMAM